MLIGAHCVTMSAASRGTSWATYVFGAAMGIGSWEYARYMGRDTLPSHPGCCCEFCVKDPLARQIAQRHLGERLGEIEMKS